MIPDVRIHEPQPSQTRTRGLVGTLRRLVEAVLKPIPEGTAPSDAAMGAMDEEIRYKIHRVVTRVSVQKKPSETPQTNRFTDIPNVWLPSGAGLSDAALGELDKVRRDLSLGRRPQNTPDFY